MILQENESIKYIGGGTLSAALVSAVSALIKNLYQIGQNLGSSIYRMFKKQYC